VFLAVLLAFRMVSLASMSAAVALPVVYGLIEGREANRILLGALIAIAVLVVVKHRSNVGRILAGNESTIRLPWQKKEV
jgi:glycerol-3-phosphate acyltransferase PlsY